MRAFGETMFLIGLGAILGSIWTMAFVRVGNVSKEIPQVKDGEFPLGVGGKL